MAQLSIIHYNYIHVLEGPPIETKIHLSCRRRNNFTNFEVSGFKFYNSHSVYTHNSLTIVTLFRGCPLYCNLCSTEPTYHFKSKTVE